MSRRWRGSIVSVCLFLSFVEYAATARASSSRVIINFICLSTCTQYGLQLIAVDGSGTAATARVQDSSTTSTTRVIGIAGPFPEVISPNFAESANRRPSCHSRSDGSCIHTKGQTVPVAISGLALCQFDNQTVPGDFIVNSTFNGGFCHDVGTSVPFADQIIGVVLTENGPGQFGQDFAQVVVLFGGGAYGSTTANG